jgi:hypothetical protein
MTGRIEQAQLRYNSLKECLIGKAPPVPVHQQCMRAAQFDDPGMDARRCAARYLRGDRVGQHDP